MPTFTYFDLAWLFHIFNSYHRIQLKKLSFDYEKFTLPLKAITDEKVSSNLMTKN